MEYNPKPINTDVVLPTSLTTLIERLSQNVHDEWAMQRINSGWRYGTSRDDEKKTSPCLVPYEYLSESEKDVDRATVLSTIKAMISLGYKISPPKPISIARRELP